jgi:hypothetical protein
VGFFFGGDELNISYKWITHYIVLARQSNNGRKRKAGPKVMA